MSRVYFHSEHDEAGLRGAERAYAGCMSTTALMAAIGPLDEYGGKPSWIRRVLPPGVNLRDDGSRGAFEESVRLYLAVPISKRAVIVNGEEHDPFAVALNTLMVAGSDPVRLLARIHGQCEIHGFVEGPNRAWLSEVIRYGRRDNVLRPDMGWESVAALLDARDDGPVVMSYSVCEQFPGRHALPAGHPLGYGAEESDEDDDDTRYSDLPDAERWRLGMEFLRANPSLEMKPGWATYRFDAGVSGFDLRPAAEGTGAPARSEGKA